MLILGIETSCDETAASVVENGTKILSNVVASSQDLHAKTGGIIPEEAARKQVEFIVPVIQEALVKAFVRPSLTKSKSVKKPEKLMKGVDAIAVTYGPGLIGSLLVGVEAAKTLAFVYNKPIIPVNHVIAHSYANFISQNAKNKKVQFPAINLIVSGGHTELLLIKGHNNLRFLGGTRDDASGEAFDKIARILGLPFPGGPSISKAAEKYFINNKTVKLDLFPRPMIDSDDYDFSFSGLKTAVKNYLRDKNKIDVNRISAEVQEAIADSLVEKTIKACNKIKPKSLLLSGGVAANERLREKLRARIKAENEDIVFHVPDIILCTDNATFIASRAYFSGNKVSWKKLEANPQLSVRDL